MISYFIQILSLKHTIHLFSMSLHIKMINIHQHQSVQWKLLPLLPKWITIRIHVTNKHLCFTINLNLYSQIINIIYFNKAPLLLGAILWYIQIYKLDLKILKQYWSLIICWSNWYQACMSSLTGLNYVLEINTSFWVIV